MPRNQEGPNNLAERGDCILVIIDVQEKLMPAISEKERVAGNVLRLVRFANITGIPIVVTEQEKLGSTLPAIKQELSAVQPVSKTHFNSFRCGEFQEKIAGTRRKTLILAGVEAHICVLQTALHGLNGHDVHVVGDATSSRNPDNWKAALERMKQSGATITTTEMFIYEILQKAGTEEFKAVLPLVK